MARKKKMWTFFIIFSLFGFTSLLLREYNVINKVLANIIYILCTILIPATPLIFKKKDDK